MFACCERPVRIAQSTFTLVYLHVAHLEKSRLARRDLQWMLFAGQFLASRDGSRVACWNTNVDETVSIVVGKVISFARFNSKGARLISIDDHLIAYGTLVDGRCGLFRLTNDGVQQISQSRPVGILRHSSGDALFTADSLNAQYEWRVYSRSLPQNGYPIDRQSLVAPLQDGRLLFFEPIGGDTCYHYLISASKGFEDFYPTAHTPVSLMAVASWKGTTVFGIKGEKESMLELRGVASAHLHKRSIHIRGELEQLWQSSTEKGIAWLSRLTANGRAYRLLFVNNRLLVQGEFAMGPNDLVWSPDGTIAAAHIRRDQNGRGQSVIVTFEKEREIRPGRRVEEFILDNHGRVQAWIECDERFSYPFVHDRPHDPVELAWNLRLIDGDIHYNCLMSDVILLVTDQTESCV